MPKSTTVRFPESQREIADKPLKNRSQWVEQAVLDLLDWEVYSKTDWSIYHAIGDGQVFLDVVEMGVEYRTKGRLLDPVTINLSPEAFKALETAEVRVIAHRPQLKGKGVISGIIRSAVAQRQLMGGA